MKKLIIILIFFLIPLSDSYSQNFLKEISKAFDNGQPMFIDYLDPDLLKKVKTEIFNEKGELIYSVQFDPITGKKNGDFFDLINKGFYKDGVLTCINCMIVTANNPNTFTYNWDRKQTDIIKGDIIDGRKVGEHITLRRVEGKNNEINWRNTRMMIAAGAPIWFRDVRTFRTGIFSEKEIERVIYNSNGVLDGEKKINNTILQVDDGLIKSLVSYDSKGLNKDSISNDFNIWRINYKLMKNYGLVVFDNEAHRDGAQFNNDENNPPFNIIKNKVNAPYESEIDKIPVGLKGMYKRGLNEDGMYNLEKKDFLELLINNPKWGDYDGGYFNILSFIYYLLNNQEKSINENFNINWSNLYSIGYNYNRYDDEKVREIILSDTINYLYIFTSFIQSTRDTRKWLQASNLKYINKEDLGDYSIPKNERFKTKTYIKKSNFKEDIIRFIYENNFGSIPVSYIFKNIISMEDILKATKETIANKETEIKEIWIWDKILKKYVQVDLDDLISKTFLYEEKIKKEEEAKEKFTSEIINLTANKTNKFSKEKPSIFYNELVKSNIFKFLKREVAYIDGKFPSKKSQKNFNKKKI